MKDRTIEPDAHLSHFPRERKKDIAHKSTLSFQCCSNVQGYGVELLYIRTCSCMKSTLSSSMSDSTADASTARNYITMYVYTCQVLCEAVRGAIPSVVLRGALSLTQTHNKLRLLHQKRPDNKQQNFSNVVSNKSNCSPTSNNPVPGIYAVF